MFFYIIQHLRPAGASMLEVIHGDYSRTARAKGLSELEVIRNRSFRNILITLIALFGGLSFLALSSRDYPLQMALFAFSGFLTLAGIMLSDLLYVAADPRIKLH